jgi:hypothetical protein
MRIYRGGIAFLLVAVAGAWGQAAGDAYGQALLDSRQWYRAVQEFNRLATSGSAQADAALFWKAYALYKLGLHGEALAALAESRRLYPMSRWLPDIAALEMDIKRAAGQSVSPEDQSTDELKLLALNDVMRSDPERAVPEIETLLRQAPRLALKREALYVLAQSPAPKAQQLLEQAARGSFKLELQSLAVRYLVLQKLYKGNLGQLLFEIYNATTDAEVRHEILMGLATIGDVSHLSQIPADAAQAAAANLPLFQQRLGLVAPQPLTETQQLARQEAATATATAMRAAADYVSQKSHAAKLDIIDRYASVKNVTALIAIARVENDPYERKKIVEHLIDLNTPEAKEYLLELLK